jgi:hypothetical protein
MVYTISFDQCGVKIIFIRVLNVVYLQENKKGRRPEGKNEVVVYYESIK